MSNTENSTWNDVPMPTKVENQEKYYQNIENVLNEKNSNEMINEIKKIIFSSDFNESILFGINFWSYIMNSYWKIKKETKLEKYAKNNKTIEFLFTSYTNFINEYFSKKVNLYNLINQTRMIEIPAFGSLSQVNEIILVIKFINESINYLKELFNENFSEKLNDLDADIINLDSDKISLTNSMQKIRFLRSIAFIHIFDYKANKTSYIFKKYYAGGYLEQNGLKERIIVVDKQTLEEITINFEYNSLRNYLMYRACILLKIYYLLTK